MPPSYVFLIDTSNASMMNGYLSSVIETIKDIINNDLFQNLSRTKIGIITYDNTINFFNLNPQLNQAQMLSVKDDLFLPVPVDYLLVNMEDSKDKILSLLDMIRDSSQNNNNCQDSDKLIEGIKAGFLLVQSTGGKILSFNSSFHFASTVK
jgi:protein transport protein SEC24